MLPICSIYGLYSTEDMIVRYIGQTTQQLRDRRQQHLAEALRPPGRSRCHRWIRKVLRSGFDIGIGLLEAECPWGTAEKKWIAEYRSKYPGIMTNLSDGGCGYTGKRSDETRAKMRKPKSAAHREKILRHVHSPEMATKRLAALQLRNPGNVYGRGHNNAMAVLTEAQVIKIKGLLQERVPISEIGVRYNVSKAAISKIRTGRTWKHLKAQSTPA